MEYIVCNFCGLIKREDECKEGVENVESFPAVICNLCIKKLNNELEDYSNVHYAKRQKCYYLNSD